jgi:hypothetical protein
VVIANQQAPAEAAYHLGFWETLDLGRWETKTFPKTAVRFSGRCFYAVGKLPWSAKPVRGQWILVRTRKSAVCGEFGVRPDRAVQTLSNPDGEQNGRLTVRD